MNATVAQLTAHSLLGRRRAAVLALLPIALLLLCGAVSLLAGNDGTVYAGVLRGFALATVVPLVGLIAGAGAIGPEIDDGSIVYLMAKPLSRHRIVASKLVVAAGVVAVLGAVPVVLAALVLTGTVGRVGLAFGVGALVSGVAYCALFLLLAVVTRNAVVIGLMYVLIWETLVGGFVPGAQALSVQQWGLAVAERVMGIEAAGLNISAAVSFRFGVVLLLVVTGGCTWLAGSRLRSLRVAGGVD